MANEVEEPAEDEEDEAGRWLVTVGPALFGFVEEAQARTAFEALKVAFVLDDSVPMLLQWCDENGNWLTMDTVYLS